MMYWRKGCGGGRRRERNDWSGTGLRNVGSKEVESGEQVKDYVEEKGGRTMLNHI